MHVTGIILAVGAAWLVQFGLTWFQIRHYRSMMRKLVNQYNHSEGFHLFSGVARKALGSGAIVLIVLDSQRVVRDLQLLVGISVFAKFKPEEAYVGMAIEEVLKIAELNLSQKRLSAKSQSVSKACRMAAENALRSLSLPKSQSVSLAR